jgi:hypothetical protein
MSEERSPSSKASELLVGAGCVFLGAIGLLQIYAGWVGIAASFGTVWAIAALACMFLFRFSIPLTFGSFLCAKDVWGWHWSLALIFALPGLVLAVPGVIAGAMGKVKQ